jgi:pimeloyl-ACP methyl ester carboxylesterase
MSEDVAEQVKAMLAGMRKPRRRGRARQAHVLADAEMQMVDGIACWRLGEGPAVLLVHGWEDDHSVWGPLIEELQRFGRSIVTCDMPGHGFSEEGQGLMSGFHDAAVKVANAMGPIDAIVGHSLGCAATVTAVGEGLLAPERMVLISAAARHKVQLDYAIEHWMEPDVGSYMRAHYDELFADDRNVFDLHKLAPNLKL